MNNVIKEHLANEGWNFDIFPAHLIDVFVMIEGEERESLNMHTAYRSFRDRWLVNCFDGNTIFTHPIVDPEYKIVCWKSMGSLGDYKTIMYR